MNPRKSVRNTFSEGTETQQLCLGRSRIIQITEAAIQTEGQLWLIYIWRNCVGNLQTEKQLLIVKRLVQKKLVQLQKVIQKSVSGRRIQIQDTVWNKPIKMK